MNRPLNIDIVSIYPDVIDSYASRGVLRAAKTKGLGAVNAVHLRDFAVDKHGSIDDLPYGGGDGMVMRPEPLRDAVLASRSRLGDDAVIIATSPAGKPWTSAEATRLANERRPLIIVCGRFGGFDQRFLDNYVDHEYSIGDFVLAGGELAALVIAESAMRLIPGVLGHADSATNDSFAPGMEYLLEHPLYTRPREFEGLVVPEVLMSGDHKEIEAWRKQESHARTAKRRPDLLKK